MASSQKTNCMRKTSSKKMSSAAQELRDHGLEDAVVKVNVRWGRDRRHQRHVVERGQHDAAAQQVEVDVVLELAVGASCGLGAVAGSGSGGVRLGAGTECVGSGGGELEDLIHLYLLNRGIMLTPFHNMALMSPVTTPADVDLHHGVFEAVIAELVGG